MSLLDLNNQRVMKKAHDTQDLILCAVVYEVGMLPVEAPYNLQICIGNVGDSDLLLDTSTELESVVTLAKMLNKTKPAQSLPSHEGELYYMPFGKEKPVLIVKGRFPQFISSMYEANMLHNLILQPLEIGLDEVDHLGPGSEEADKRLCSLLHEFLTGCCKYLELSSVRKFETNIKRMSKDVRGFFEKVIPKVKEEEEEAEEEENDSEDETENDEERTKKEEKRKEFELMYERMKGFLVQLQQLIEIPMETIPDVIFWVFKRDKRVAFKRIPARHVLHASSSYKCGYKCGRLVTLLLRELKGKTLHVAARVDLWMWLGVAEEYPKCLQSLRNCTQLDTAEIPETLILNVKWEFQLLAHVYCGILTANTEMMLEGDFTIRASFSNQSLVTASSRSYGPTWNETLVFPPMELYGPISTLTSDPPVVILEIFKGDNMRKHTYFGRAVGLPQIMYEDFDHDDAKVQCLKVYHNEGEVVGEIWVSLQLLSILAASKIRNIMVLDDPYIHIRKNILHMCSYRLEVMFLIIQDIARSTNKLKVVLHCAGNEVKFTATKDAVFENPWMKVDVNMPHLDEHHFPVDMLLINKKNRVLGSHRVKNILSLLCPLIPLDEFKSRIKTVIISKKEIVKYDHEYFQIIEKKSSPVLNSDSTFMIDWWDKYMTEKVITKYSEELENQLKFCDISNTLITFEFTESQHKKQEKKTLCKLKGTIKLYQHPVPEDHIVVTGENPKFGLISTDMYKTVNVLVRVYIVRCWDLKSKDYGGSSDPYVIVELNKKKLNNRDEYVPSDLNPLIGKCFEMSAKLPQEHNLLITLMDYDFISSDDIIGQTSIDLNDRFFTKHHARCGIAPIYRWDGVNKWRDSEKPSEILTKLCKKYSVIGPSFTEHDEIILGPHEFFKVLPDTEEKREQLSVFALQQWHELSQVGFHLVPEHIETRSLFLPGKGSAVQGKVEMWVDIFSVDDGKKIPEVINISLRPPVEYELRVIIWSARNVPLVDSILGTKYTDVYIKAQLGDHKEKTDVHYGSLTGNAEFNWRMLFKLTYLQIEKLIVLHKKSISGTKRSKDTKGKCHLLLSIWDKDFVSFDDPIGSLTLDLHSIPAPAQHPEDCELNVEECFSLFEARKLEGWWAFHSEKSQDEPAGIVNAQILLLPIEEALNNPAGRGHSEPEALSKPDRPESVYKQFLHPLRMLKLFAIHTNIRKHLWKIVVAVIVIVLLVAILKGVFTGVTQKVERMII